MQGGLVKLRASNHHCFSETQIFALEDFFAKIGLYKMVNEGKTHLKISNSTKWKKRFSSLPF